MSKTTHGACGTRWTQRGNSTGHCAGCHRTFATSSLFDRHRTGPWEDRLCLDPATEELGTPKRPLNVVQDSEGVWWTVEGLANFSVIQNRARDVFLKSKNGLTGQTPTPTPEMRYDA